MCGPQSVSNPPDTAGVRCGHSPRPPHLPGGNNSPAKRSGRGGRRKKNTNYTSIDPNQISVIIKGVPWGV